MKNLGWTDVLIEIVAVTDKDDPSIYRLVFGTPTIIEYCADVDEIDKILKEIFKTRDIRILV